MNNKRFTPKYDTDYVQLWFFNQKILQEINLVGEVRTYMGSNLPQGWILCDGSELSRNQYKSLFDVIGTEYGDGDEISTFNVPTLTDEDSILGYKIIKY